MVKKLPIDFEEIAMAMEFDRDYNEYYLDGETGEVIIIMIEYLHEAEEELESDEESEGHDHDWMNEMLDQARAIIRDSKDRYHYIPQQSSDEGWQIMENFIEEVDEENLQEKLYIAIRGKGAFRRFKDVLLNYPDHREQWFAFKNDAHKKEIMEWLAELGIEGVVKQRSGEPDMLG